MIGMVEKMPNAQFFQLSLEEHAMDGIVHQGDDAHPQVTHASVSEPTSPRRRSRPRQVTRCNQQRVDEENFRLCHQVWRYNSFSNVREILCASSIRFIPMSGSPAHAQPPFMCPVALDTTVGVDPKRPSRESSGSAAFKSIRQFSPRRETTESADPGIPSDNTLECPVTLGRDLSDSAEFRPGGAKRFRRGARRQGSCTGSRFVRQHDIAVLELTRGRQLECSWFSIPSNSVRPRPGRWDSG